MYGYYLIALGLCTEHHGDEDSGNLLEYPYNRNKYNAVLPERWNIDDGIAKSRRSDVRSFIGVACAQANVNRSRFSDLSQSLPSAC